MKTENLDKKLNIPSDVPDDFLNLVSALLEFIAEADSKEKESKK